MSSLRGGNGNLGKDEKGVRLRKLDAGVVRTGSSPEEDVEECTETRPLCSNA